MSEGGTMSGILAFLLLLTAGGLAYLWSRIENLVGLPSFAYRIVLAAITVLFLVTWHMTNFLASVIFFPILVGAGYKFDQMLSHFKGR